MDLLLFTRSLSSMGREDIRVVADAIERSFATSDGEVAWWRAHLDIDAALKQGGGFRSAATAAHAASDAVLAAAERAGFELPDEQVTRLAREAQEVARAIVAGQRAERALGALLVNWQVVLRPVGV